MFSLEGGRGCGISWFVRASREKDTCRSAFSRESNGRVIINLGRGGRREARQGTLVGGGVLSGPKKGSHRMHRASVVARMLYRAFSITHRRCQ